MIIYYQIISNASILIILGMMKVLKIWFISEDNNYVINKFCNEKLGLVANSMRKQYFLWIVRQVEMKWYIMFLTSWFGIITLNS